MGEVKPSLWGRARAGLGRCFADRWFPFTSYALLVGLFVVYGVSRVDTFSSFGYDLGIFDQAVRHYAHLQPPIVTLKGDNYNILADHFHPIIVVWAPLYWIWDDIRVLVIGQALVVAAAVFPIWSFLRRKAAGLPGTTRCAKLLVAGIMLAWPMQGLIGFDVHEIAFAIPLLAWAVDLLDRRSDRALIVCCALLLLVREDMGMMVATVGFIRLLRGRADGGRRTWRDWILPVCLALVGLAATGLATQVVIPHFSNQGYHYWSDVSVGGGARAELTELATKPWLAVSRMFTPLVKTWTWLALLAPLAFLPLRSPYALLGLVLMVERMLAQRENLWTIHYHYNAPVWIVFALAAADALERLPRGLTGRWRWTGSRRRLPVLTGLVAAVTVLGLAVGMIVPWVGRMFPMQRMITGRAFVVGPIQQPRADVVRWLPANTCVAADDRVAGQLTHSNRVTVPGVSQHRQDFYVLDLAQPHPATTPAMWTTAATLDHALGLGFHQVYESGGIIVLQAPDYAGPDPVNCGWDSP